MVSDGQAQVGDAAPKGAGAPPRRQRYGIELFAVFCLGLALMTSVYRPYDRNAAEIGVPGHDSFYHIKMAELLPQFGLLDRFPWLRFVYFRDAGDAFVSHHYGFHVILWPFVAASNALYGDALPGGRWAMTFFFGLNLVLFDLILIRSGVRSRWFWLLLMVCLPAHFYTRQAYVRAIGPSLSLLLLMCLLLHRRGRAVWLGLVIALSIQIYLGSVMFAPMVIALYALACVAAPVQEREWPMGLLLWCVAGWVAGILLHPYAGGMAEFLRLQVFGSGLSPDIEVGSEWRPYENLWWFAQFVATPMSVWLTAMLLRLRLGPAIDRWTMFLLLLNVAFLLLVLKARRFMEYWPVFCLLASAVTAAPAVNPAVSGMLEWATARGAVWRRLVTWLPVGAALLVGSGIVLASPLWHDIRGGGRCKYDLAAVREAMAYLKEHSQPGDVIFTDDWDIFPVYFYYNSYDYYIVGLDPKFTQERRPELWQRYVQITRGQTPRTDQVTIEVAPGERITRTVESRLADIRDEFGARFAIVDGDHQPLFDDLRAATDFATLVYPNGPSSPDTAPYRIFRIHPRTESAGG
ncbi:MAG: hypothetical protein J5J06_11260 [Phycisphaerae bacterium]|nr:hypothetical protein [Phycisphaerae bacterium]